MKPSRTVWLLITVFSFVLGFLVYQFIVVGEANDLITSRGEPKTSVIKVSQITLQSKNGDYKLLSNDGKIRILYFGYTQCPDVCPTSLSVLSAALQQLTKTELEKVTPIFITVDPDRDSVAIISEYARYFHKNIIGLSGNINTINKIVKQLGVIYKYVKLENSQLAYSVDHSSIFYFLNDRGEVIQQIQHTYSVEPIVHALKKQIKINAL